MKFSQTLRRLTQGNSIWLAVLSIIIVAVFVPRAATSTSTARQDAAPAAPTVRQITLRTKDLIYDPVTQRIYASVPSSAGVIGDSITQIDPVLGTVGASVAIGSEPGKLAISDNSQYIYAALDGAAAVRRFDLATQTAGLQFSLGTDSLGTFYAEDIGVMPGQPGTVAISRKYLGFSPRHAGVGIYDDGIVRPGTTPTHTGSNVIEFSAAATTLYGHNNESGELGFRKMAIDASGVSVVSTVTHLFFGQADIVHDNGLVYATSGHVVDGATGNQVGKFSGVGSPARVLVDSAAGKVYFLTGSDAFTTLKVYNQATFLQTGSLTIPAVSGTPSSLIKWATGELAFRTSGDQIFLVSTSEIPATPPTPLPSPVPVMSGIFKLQLATSDLVYDPNSAKVYAGIPSSAGSFGNSIASINPVTAAIDAPVFVGSEPSKVAMSTDRQFIYAGLEGAGAVRRFDLASQTAGLQFHLGGNAVNGPYYVEDIAVAPGDPNVVAVSRQNRDSGPGHEGVGIYDGGVLRPTVTASHTGSNVIEFSAAAATLYGYNNETSEFGFRRMAVDSNGVTVTSTVANLIGLFNVDIKFDNGRVYASSGRVIDPEAGTILGTFPGVSTLAFVPDSTNKLAFFVTGNGSSATLQAFDINTFAPVGSVNIPGVTGQPLSLVRWGLNGLAFRTSTELFFIQTPLIQILVNDAGDAADNNVGDGLCDTSATAGSQCTLRAAIEETNAQPTDDNIAFDPSLNGATVNLDTALPDISSNLAIGGPGASLLSVRRSLAGGTPDFRVFTINSGKAVTISGLTISNGRATGTNGGGILNSGALALNSCAVSGNSSTGAGGGVKNEGTLILNNTSIINNTGSSGGGIFNGVTNADAFTTVTVTVNNSTISSNTASGAGAGLYNAAALSGRTAILTVYGSTISGNLNGGSSSGGGIYNAAVFGGTATLAITNSTVSNNSADKGGGIHHISSSPGSTATATITNCTLSLNNSGPATDGGGGIFTSSFSSTTNSTLRNTIVAGNFRNLGTAASDISGSVDAASSFSLIGNGTGMTGVSHGVNGNQVGTSLAPINARLAPLSNNGGPTLTHALLSGSPALDAGNNALVVSPPFSASPFTDQRGSGFLRILDSADPNTTPIVDIGAFEANPSLEDITDKTIGEDVPLSFSFNVGDSTTAFTSITATSGNASLVPNAPANLNVTGSGSTRSLNITPAADQSGNSTITVTATKTIGSTIISMSDSFVLTVTAASDQPTDIALSSNTVLENSPSATTVGAFSTTDIDVGDTFTYSLVSGQGSFDNAAFSISGNQLRTSSVFDFEDRANYSIRVRSTDSGGGFFEKQFSITATDGPDNPGAISFSSANYSVGEGDGSANITLTRTGGTDKVSARVSLADVTTSPADYLFKPGTFDASFNVGTGATSGSSSVPQFVRAVALQPDGKIIIGGAFLFFNGTPRNRLARLNADGTLDLTFNPGSGANNDVNAIAVQPDGKILIGGAFTTYNGASRIRIARLNSDGSVDPTFGGVPDDTIRAIVVQPDGKILIGGDFFLYNGSSRNHIVRLNSDGGIDFSFNTGLGANAPVTALTLQPDGKILVGGGFLNFGSASNTRLVRLESNGSLDSSFTSATLLSMVPHHIVLQSNGKILVGGEFINTDSPLGRRGIARLNNNGSEDVTFNVGIGTDGHTVEAIALQPDGKIIVAGQFTTFNTTPIGRIARLNSDGALDDTFTPAPGANFPVFGAVLQADGKIVIGGQYTFYDNVSSNGITRVNNDLFVTWPAGDLSNKTVVLPIIDDAQLEPSETLTLTVNPLTAGATTGANPNATLTIVDNDQSATALSAVSGSGVFGGSATLTATLTSLGNPLSGKTVSFTLNGTFVGDALTNTNGVATLAGVSVAGIDAGFYPSAVGASFAGDINFASSSNTGPLNVARASTATTVTSSANPSAFGQSVTFTATVTSPGGVPGGTVQFQSDGSNIGAPVTLNASGVATLTTSALTPGSHSSTADYSGNSNFLFSTGIQVSAQVVIPAVTINDVSVSEGDSGTKTANFTVTLEAASNQIVRVNFATTNGSATAGSDYQSASDTLTFDPGQTTRPISVTINGDTSFESNETFVVNLTSPVNAAISDSQGLGTINNDDVQGGFVSFSQANYTIGESGGSITITVNRGNDLSGAATVDYFTSESGGSTPCSTVNGLASSRCDFTTSLGTLRFAAGESAKTFTVLISQDNYVEGPESLALALANPTGGAAFVTPSTATLTITDDASEPVANPADDPDVFVRQHYHDFLNREADAPGLAFWTNQITECQQPGATCSAEVRRINVSAAFFLSIEFQETGYLVYRTYKSAYGNIAGTPVPLRLIEFLPDTQQIGKGVQVGVGNWEAQLESNKVAYALDFVSRARFVAAYPTTLTPAEFVDALFANGGVTPSATDRDAAIGEFGGAGNTTDTAARARALRRVAENATLKQQEFNRAFVLMQYFGYLRRNPNDAPEANLDFGGYNFWLSKLNEFNGNFVNAEMVKAFIVSGEYRQRFGP